MVLASVEVVDDFLDIDRYVAEYKRRARSRSAAALIADAWSVSKARRRLTKFRTLSRNFLSIYGS